VMESGVMESASPVAMVEEVREVEAAAPVAVPVVKAERKKWAPKAAAKTPTEDIGKDEGTR